MAALDFEKLHHIIGRAQIRMATSEDVNALIDHISALEDLLEAGDANDAFGTEGWRHYLGIDQ